MDSKQNKYAFSWDLVGDNGQGARPSLGDSTSLQVYRLFQFSIRDALERRYGKDAADEIFHSAGVIAGQAFFDRYCAQAKTVAELAKIIQDRFRELSIGLVRFEQVDLEAMSIRLTVDEDLDCSGMPDTNEQVCVFDEGLIKGILDSFTGSSFSVKEIDCWRSGERTCRFQAVQNK